MKTLAQLKDDLEGYPKKEQLDALSDGEFLSHYSVTEDEVEALCYEIEGDE
jgi:hypothetical protein